MDNNNFNNANNTYKTIQHKSVEQYSKDYNKSLKDNTKSNSKSINNSSSNYLSLFKIILILLIFVVLIRFLYGGAGNFVSFGNLLDLLKNVPQVSTSFKNFSLNLQITSDWGIINGLRDFLNTWITSFSVVHWIFLSLIDVLLFISYFLVWIFV